jgi:stearoyl-CoA desaturase (delta-9 desaturase)
LVGSIAVILMPPGWRQFAKWAGLAVSVAVLVVSIVIAVEFKTGGPIYQFVETHRWIPAFGAGYTLGVDGIALVLVLLLAFLGNLRAALAVAGSLAIEGPLLVWVADHRRHHKYSDREGDPHSPWRFGTDWKALTKGFLWAHMGWMFNPNRTSQRKFCPDLLADRPMRRISRLFPLWVVLSLLAPPLIGGLWSMSLTGALTAFFWASLVRLALLHHVTWSINSVCHTFGKEDFVARDKSRNVAWLAIPSFGESWHNLHHADPTCARHGALKGQIDISARVIRWCEQLRWAWDVRWPDAERLAPKLTGLRNKALGSMTVRRTASRGDRAAV